ncbi:hypothetical protein E4T56_gene5522 [Termitomyces sp. T112]|nr:hypothetical protein E4T56_gene5522 [Termitomyces sp. T112]KAH0583753.1 hypothetical protein H2248_009357 [Termitomyces sp. 'cryptogamus']
MALRDQVPRIVIVGAGLGGISAAIQLKRQLGFQNFTIYEKATAVGGTWRDNTYPGCGSDVPGHWYSLSTDLNPNWSSHYVSQPEIRAYWEELYFKYDLPSQTQLGHMVVQSQWDSEAHLYHITVKEVATGQTKQIEAEIMINAIGGFMNPVFPKDIEGVEKFRGSVWHSARWRHDVDLKGKRVAVIGNGCSAAQIVPEISADPLVNVTNFCRTPQWYLPRGNYRYSSWIKWVFAYVPFVMRWYRNLIMARSDSSYLIFRKDNRFLVAAARWFLSSYIKKTAPKDLVQSLTPTYAPGCKRIIVDPGYLESLHKPNVSISWDAIKGIVEEGIELKSGKVVPFDVIVFSTGYSLESADLDVRGSKKYTIREYFASQGGPTAYLGTCLPGFPNFFMLLGPNVATGHASIIFSQEAQIGLAIQLIKPILAGKAKSFEVREEATDKYNKWLQNRLVRSVWTDCNSYYQAGGQKQTKIIATFPGPVGLFWWLTLRPRWNEFIGVGAEAWETEQRRAVVRRRILFVGLVAVAAGLGVWLQGKPLVNLVKRILSLVVV